MNATEVRRLRELAALLSRTSSQDQSDSAIRGLAIGAAYSLAQALHLGYRDLTGTKQDPGYRRQLAKVATALADNETIPRQWLANYYFNNALVRLAARA